MKKPRPVPPAEADGPFIDTISSTPQLFLLLKQMGSLSNHRTECLPSRAAAQRPSHSTPQPRADGRLLLSILAEFFSIPHSPKANSKETSLGHSFRGGNQTSKVEFTFLHGRWVSDPWAHCLPSCPSRRNKNTNSRPQESKQGFTWTRRALLAPAYGHIFNQRLTTRTIFS